LIYRAVLQALEDANAIILSDQPAAASVLLTSTAEGGFSQEEIVDLLRDPSIKFTTTPENVMRYADFMHSIGSITNRPAAWKDLFFPEIHGTAGS
jgi:NitT/TauT family transport system substrate-binding protein